jgi:hypothetical protein
MEAQDEGVAKQQSPLRAPSTTKEGEIGGPMSAIFWNKEDMSVHFGQMKIRRPIYGWQGVRKTDNISLQNKDSKRSQ